MSQQTLRITVYDGGDKNRIADLVRDAMFQANEDQVPNIYETNDGLTVTLSQKHIEQDMDTAIEHALDARWGDPGFDWKWE